MDEKKQMAPKSQVVANTLAPVIDRIPTSKRKWADTPHPVTMIIAAITLLATLIGYMIAYKALGLNENSLKLSQRAYLAVEGSPGSGVKWDMVLFPHKIKTLGNTPAINVTESYRYDGPPEVRFPSPFKNDVGTVGPKDSTPMSPSVSVGWNDAELQRRGLTRDSVVLNIHGSLQYTDVFGEQHVSEWCWAMNSGFISEGCVTNYYTQVVPKRR